MLIFAASGKGGTGRSVTSGNVAYRHALQGNDTCFADFDFGSPTAGAIFDLPDAAGVSGGGLHSHLLGCQPQPPHVDVWTDSQSNALRGRPPGAGRLVLVPGDRGGGEFGSSTDIVERCADLLRRADEEFDLTLVDLSAGRSYATEIVLAATAQPQLRGVAARWAIFHRWTRQHILAAGDLVHGSRGLLETAEQFGHDRAELSRKIRFVRTAVPDPTAPEQAGLRPEQLAWMDHCDSRLQDLAGRSGLGRASLLGEVPLDPVLQWQEQVLSNDDVWLHRLANQRTVLAFEHLAKGITDQAAWEEGL